MHLVHSLPSAFHVVSLSSALWWSTKTAGLFLRVRDQVYLFCDVFPLSAENKRRSKHAGKSINPEWNQTVIYKNILLEQVCGPKEMYMLSPSTWLKASMEL